LNESHAGEDWLAATTTAGETLSLSIAAVLEREEKQLEALLGRGYGLLDDQVGVAGSLPALCL
jgi:hypothetical protein